jgi:hypothetical protein
MFRQASLVRYAVAMIGALRSVDSCRIGIRLAAIMSAVRRAQTKRDVIT